MDGLGPINLDILLNNPELLASLERGERDTQNATASMQRMATQTSSSLDTLAKRAAAAAAGYFSITAAKEFVVKLVQVRGEFEQLNVAYTTMLGSKAKADALFAETVRLAETTPFSLMEVAQGTKQLLAYGFSAEEVTGTLSKLGDIAAGIKAPIGDIAYLYGTLKVQGRAYAQDIRQFTGRGIPIIAELAKQFDTTEANVNKLVEAGKVGFPEVEKAFNSITGAGGQFFRLMENQSKTVTGQISNLGDAFDQVLNDIGASNQGLITGTLSGVSTVLENYEQLLDILKLLIATYSAYKAAVITTDAFAAFSAARQVTENIQRFNGASFVTVQVTRELTVAQTLQAGAANVAGKAYDFLNKTMLANPYVALTIGFAAMAYQLYDVSKKTNYAAEASEAYVEAMGKEQFKLGELFQKLEGTKPGTEERRKSIVELKNAYGEYLPKMDLEKANLADLKKAYGEVNQKITENIALKSKGDQTQKLYDDFGKRYAEITKKITAEVEDISGSAQAGAAAVMVDRLINEALTGKTFLGAGFRGSNQGGGKLMEQAQKYRLQLSGKKDLSETGGLGEYLNQLQIVVDQQRQAQAALNQFYGGVEKATSKGKNDLSDAQKAALLFIERLKEPVKNFDLLLKTASSKDDLDKLKKTLEEKRDALAPNDKEIASLQARVDKVKAVLAVYDPKAQTKAANAEESEFLKRQRLFEKIGELQEQSLSSAKSADEQEVDQVKQKYEKILREIDNYNRKAKVKIDPKNIKLSDGTTLNIPDAEKNAEDTVRAQQQVKKQEEALNAQKALYDEFEAYKKQVNAQTATAIYSQELKGFSSYVAYLENQLKQLEGKTDAYSNAYRDVLNKELPKAKLDEGKRQSQDFLALLSGAQTYEEQRQKIIDDGIKAANDLRAKGYEFEATQAATNSKKQLTALDEAHIRELDAYKELFDDLEVISTQRAKDDISSLRNYIETGLKSGKITRETYLVINKMLNEAEQKANSALPNGLRKVASEMGEVANSVGQFDQKLGKALGTLGGLITGVANIKDNLNTLNLSGNAVGGDIFSKLTAGVSIFNSVFGLASGIASIFDSSQQKAEQRAYENDRQLALIQSVNKALERQLALTKEIYGPERLEAFKKDLKDIQQAQVEANAKIQGKLALTGNKEVDENIITRLNNGEKANYGSFNKYGEQYDKLVSAGKVLSLTGKGIEELTNLMESKQLDERTAAIVQSMIDLENKAKETKNALAEEVTGINFDSLKDSISQLFSTGEGTFDNIQKALEKSIQQALLKGFERNQIEKALQPFYDALYEAGLDGKYTDDEIAALRAQKEAISAQLEKQAEAYKEIAGVDPEQDATSNSSLSGAIKGITAEQANVLEGTTRGMQLQGERKIALQVQSNQTQAEQLSETRKQTLTLIEIAANTKRTADNSDKIVTSLENIDKNTKDTASGILRGQGKV